MVLNTNGIDTSKLPIEKESFTSKGVEFYENEAREILESIDRDSKQGFVSFKDTEIAVSSSPSLKMDF